MSNSVNLSSQPVAAKALVGPIHLPTNPTVIGATKPVKRTGSEGLKFHMAGRDFAYPNLEIALLSACINDQDIRREVLATVKPGLFHQEKNHGTFRAITHLEAGGKPVSVGRIARHLKATLPDYSMEWGEHVVACASAQFNPDHIPGYMGRLAYAEKIRGGGSYCEYKYSESFCADLLLCHLPPVKSVGKKLFMFEDGVWRETDTNEIRPTAYETIHPHQRQSKRINEIIDQVQSKTQVRRDTIKGAYMYRDDTILLNVANGTLEIAADGSIALREPEPGDGFTAKYGGVLRPGRDLRRVPASAGRGAPRPRRPRGDAVLWWVHPHAQHRARDIFGALRPRRHRQSKIAGAYADVLGVGVCSAISLEALCNDNSYFLAGLKRKMLNLGTELAGTEIQQSANFKKLVSGEAVSAREIYGHPEEFTSTCKLMFLTNLIPYFRRGTDAEVRRLRILHFNKKPRKKDPKLGDKLRAEMSGILNYMLEGLRKLIQTGTIPEGGKQARAKLAEFAAKNDPVGSFIKECCDFGPNHRTPKCHLWVEFAAWCDDNGYTADKLKARLAQTLLHEHALKTERERTDGERQRVYVGVRLRE